MGTIATTFLTRNMLSLFSCCEGVPADFIKGFSRLSDLAPHEHLPTAFLEYKVSIAFGEPEHIGACMGFRSTPESHANHVDLLVFSFRRQAIWREFLVKCFAMSRFGPHIGREDLSFQRGGCLYRSTVTASSRKLSIGWTHSILPEKQTSAMPHYGPDLEF
jgi:hypothetical protein